MILAGTVLVSLAVPGVPAFAASDAAPGIPSAATVRSLGDIAEGTCPDTFLPYACKADSPGWPYPGITFPLTVPGMGIPVGGIGAGSFMINQSGTFGPWFFGGEQNSAWETRALSQAAFHVREQVGDADPTVRTLATDGAHAVDHEGTVLETRSWEDPLPAWNTLEAGDADYAALYPFGWMDYEPFQTDVSMQFYSPIVAGDERLSSLPVAYFDVRIENTTGEPAEVSTMFTMPNVAAHSNTQPDTVRTGLSSAYEVDDATGVHAVTLSSDSEENTADAYKSEWTIAAEVSDGQSFSYTTSWNAAGDGSDVYAPFSDTGSLGDDALDSSASAGAISVTATLAPGEVATIPFVLSWDFPQVSFNGGSTVWMRHYTNFYGAKTDERNDYIAGSYDFHQSFEIAADALRDRDENLAAVHGWWDPIVEGDQPEWLTEAALNQLANVTFHTSVWEGGLVRSDQAVITGEDRIGSRVPGTHNYLGLDSNSGGLSTLGQGGEVGVYSYSVYSDLFPFIERDRMRGKVEAILADSTAGDPWDFGMNARDGDDPFIVWNQGTDAGPGLSWFLDRPALNVFRMYDYAQRNDDREFLESAYPAMQKTFAYLQKTIPADYALPEVPSANHPSPDLLSPQPMSNVFNGYPSNRFDSYVSSLYIVALEAMIQAGEQLGEEQSVIDGLTADLSAARADFDELFWIEGAGYYQYTLPEGDATDGRALIATFLAQYLAERADLPDVIPVDRYASHLETVHAFVSGAVDADGRPTGVSLLGSATSDVGSVVPEAVYSYAANLIDAGRRTGDDALVTLGLQVGEEVATQLWGVEENGYQFNTPGDFTAADVGTFTYPSWEGNLAVWQIFDALEQTRDVVSTPTPTPTETAAPTPTPTASGGAVSPLPGSALDEANRGGMTVSPATVEQGGTVTVRADRAGQPVEVWLYSTPARLASLDLDAGGRATVVIPTGTPVGEHRIAVYDAQGELVGWAPLRVIAGDLATTGGAIPVVMLVAGALLLGAGLSILIIRRRRHPSL